MKRQIAYMRVELLARGVKDFDGKDIVWVRSIDRQGNPLHPYKQHDCHPEELIPPAALVRAQTRSATSSTGCGPT